MSEVSGKEVVEKLRRQVAFHVATTINGPLGKCDGILWEEETKALLSHIDALEEVAKEAKQYFYTRTATPKSQEDAGLLKALNRLRELDKQLPTFDDVKGILADGEE